MLDRFTYSMNYEWMRRSDVDDVLRHKKSECYDTARHELKGWQGHASISDIIFCLQEVQQLVKLL